MNINILSMDNSNKLEQEFESIYKDNWTELVFFAKRIVGNGDAEDIVQQVMNKIWIHIQREKILNPRAWLYHVVYNECKNFLRSRKKQKIVKSAKPEPKDITEIIDSHWQEPIETLIRLEQFEMINTQVMGFSKMEKHIFFLTYQCSFPFSLDEIAQILDTNKQTISAAKTRLMVKLKHFFQDKNEKQER